jgi:quercetin dioxygenase-like cupin family protein
MTITEAVWSDATRVLTEEKAARPVIAERLVTRLTTHRKRKNLKAVWSEATKTKDTLQGAYRYFYNLYMRTARLVGLVFLASAALAQQQQPVEITSEPRHHLVFENEYVRVFDVTVAPRDTTLVHRHNHDYLFVTLGDSDVVSARPGEKPVSLVLKDGEVRFTPGNFAHAAINNSDRPFHNITIELLKPSANVKTCTEACVTRPYKCPDDGNLCPQSEKRISADQWTVSLVTLPPSARMEQRTNAPPRLIVAVSDLDFAGPSAAAGNDIKRTPGYVGWVPAGVSHPLTNHSSKPAQFVTLEFKPEQQKQ